MIRALALWLAVLSTPALAWEFSPRPICTLSHLDELAETTVTYDPASGEYAIGIRLISSTWPAEDAFGIRFEGAAPNVIVTDRHQISESGTVLTVTDRGFGNVLNGLEFNARAVALTGDLAVSIDLDGAAPEVARFRDCGTAPTA